MAGPYTFEIDRDGGTWTAYNASDNQIDSGQLPLSDSDRLEAIFNDRGVSDPTTSAVLDYEVRNWSDKDV